MNSLVDAPASANVADGVCETGPGNGVCTLRAAVMEANAVAGGGARIEVPAGLYSLTRGVTDEDAAVSGDLDITRSVTLDGEGPGVTIVDGSQIDRVLSNVAAAVTVRDLTVRNGNAHLGNGGGIANSGDLTLENVFVSASRAALGGGIANSGTLDLRHRVVEDNTPFGIYSLATLRVTDSIVRRNTDRGLTVCPATRGSSGA